MGMGVGHLRRALVAMLLAAGGGLGPVRAPRAAMLAPPVGVFVLPPAVVGGATRVYTHHAARTRTAPFPVTYSYVVAVRAPAALGYSVEIYALALHARRAAGAAGAASALPALALAHSAIVGAWLRGVVTARSCALVVGAVYRNLLLAVNAAHTYAGRNVSGGCRRDIATVLAVERHLLARAQDFANRH